MGGGGVVLGSVRSVRCSVFREVRADVRAISFGRVGAEMALECGSIATGRRVNV